MRPSIGRGIKGVDLFFCFILTFIGFYLICGFFGNVSISGEQNIQGSDVSIGSATHPPGGHPKPASRGHFKTGHLDEPLSG